MNHFPELEGIVRAMPVLEPLAEMVRGGRGAFSIAMPGRRVEDIFWEHGGTVLLIQDGPDSRGPEAFPGVADALARCGGVALLEDSYPAAYFGAALLASMGTNMALIHCSPTRSAEWTAECEKTTASLLHVVARAEGGVQ